MLNKIWGIMILIGVVYGACTGNLEAVTDAALSSAKDAVSLCITMIGVMSLWVGLMEIASDAGIIDRMTRRLQPFMNWMFPRIPEGHKSREYIATNIIANILGLGWAATPAGLKAMEELSKLEEERNADAAGHSQVKPGYIRTKDKKVHRIFKAGIASNEMCTFLIINISSLQLIPVNIIAYRSQYGSVNPTAIIGPGLVATLCSTLVAVVFCKVMTGKTTKKRSP